MCFCEYILEDMSMCIQRREGDRLVRLSTAQIRSTLLLAIDCYIRVLVFDNMSAKAWLEEEMRFRRAVGSWQGIGGCFHGEVMDSS